MRLGLDHVRDLAFFVVMQTRILKVPGYAARMRALFDAAQASRDDWSELIGISNSDEEFRGKALGVRCHETTHQDPDEALFQPGLETGTG